MSRAHRGCVKHAALLIAAAFTTLPAFAATDVVTNLSDTGVSGDGSLRGEILAAAAGDTIVFAPGLTGTITLLTGTASLKFSGNCGLIIAKNLTISGPGASILAVSGNHDGAVGSVFCIGSVAAISGLTIENGKAGSTGFGGGINAAGGSTLTVTNSIISGNSGGSGGGINNGGTGTVTNSTISDNTATTGGGIFNGGILTVTNSTIAGNIAGGFGGGIYNEGLLTVTNSTVSSDSASDAGGIYSANPATLKSTILANNGAGGNCAGPVTITSAGYNLSDDTSCSGFTQTGDLNNIPAGLDPNGLQNNGGPTPTIALLPGSRAVDHIPPSACTDQSGNPVTVDQRYVMRPQGQGCDIGAYELAAAGAFQVRYVSNLNIGDSVIDITNDGQTAPSVDPVLPTASNLCVGVYTFDANEELQSCCACLVTPNGLGSLSAQAITSTSLTGENPSSLVVKLLAWSTTAGASSTAPPGTPAPPTSTSCNPATPGAISGGMHAWGTTVHALPVGGPSSYTVTETAFSPGNLSPAEYAHITQSCEFNQINGSAQSGQCKGCASGGQ